MSTTTQGPTLSELRPQFEALERARPAAEAALARARGDKATGKDRATHLQAESIRQTNELREEDDAVALEVFFNPACDLEAAAERGRRKERLIAKLDRWYQRFVEEEWFKLDVAERQAEINLLNLDLDLAALRVTMAQSKLQEDTAGIDQQHGGVLIHSNLIDALQQDAANASRAYFGALDSLKEAVSRQEQRRAVIASIGLVTSRNVGSAIARY